MIIETWNVITVDAATREEKEVAQHMAKAVINAVVRTTLKRCAKVDPVRDLSRSQGMTQDRKGQIGPMEENAHTDVMCMKLKSVMMTWGTLLSRSSHCFISKK